MKSSRCKIIIGVAVFFILDTFCLWISIDRNIAGKKEEFFYQENYTVEYSTKPFASEGYVRSATYFSDEWPVNFWNSEMDDLDAELEQIAIDGFDSIILVIPWREFQSSINPIGYNDYAFAALDRVMEAAHNHGLDVYTRIGYTWDYYNDVSGSAMDRFYSLMEDDNVIEAWYAYVSKMYYELSQYDNFAGGFLTWEDFWNVLEICNSDSLTRQYKAVSTGYIDWIQRNYTLNEYNERYGTFFEEYEDIVIPSKTEPAMYAMYEFYDDFLNNLLKNSQRWFPDLSMEVRLDWDGVINKEGEAESYKHNSTFPCADSSFTSTMYGIPMGFANEGEKVSYEEAIEKTEYILSQLKLENNNKPVYVEQFIFADNTPAFSHNAQIIKDQVGSYLENVGDILLENSEGYGIWTYRDYCENMIYNAQFALEMDGWGNEGQVRIQNQENSNVCVMSKGSSISQRILQRDGFRRSDICRFEVEVKKISRSGKLTITVEDSSEEIEITEAGRYFVDIHLNKNGTIAIRTDCNITIDNIKFYAHTQEGLLYDKDNNELECISSLRTLNSRLREGRNAGK